MTENKIAVITGAATGIGRACAERLAKDGYSIVASYRTKEKEITDLLKTLNGSTHFKFKGDISDPDIARNLIEFAASKFNRIDVLVNAAGVYEEHEISRVSYEEWNRSWTKNLSVNLVAPMNLAFCASKHMIKNGHGKIINISSRGAFRGEPDAPAYGASKSALNSASQSLAKALGVHGIYVYSIAPGWVDTPMASSQVHGVAGDEIRSQSPLSRVGKPSEIAHIVSFLANDGAEYLTGAIIDANGASFFRN